MVSGGIASSNSVCVLTKLACWLSWNAPIAARSASRSESAAWTKKPADPDALAYQHRAFQQGAAEDELTSARRTLDESDPHPSHRQTQIALRAHPFRIALRLYPKVRDVGAEPPTFSSGIDSVVLEAIVVVAVFAARLARPALP